MATPMMLGSKVSTMIDSHCHLASEEFDDDLDEVLSRARAAGITQMLTIGDSIEESKKCLEIAEKYEQIFCSVGVHPHNAKDWDLWSAKALKEMVASSKKVRAIGEMGLDYHYNNSEPADQRVAFLQQLQIAKELSLPAVVHCREAVEDVWAIVEDVRPKRLVLHCCTEKWPDVERFVKRGYFLSFTGIATYPNAAEIRNTIAHCPLEQLMIETDAPFLAPIPHRGKRNEPAFVAEVLACVAKEKGIAPKEVDRMTTENAMGFFGL